MMSSMIVVQQFYEAVDAMQALLKLLWFQQLHLPSEDAALFFYQHLRTTPQSLLGSRLSLMEVETKDHTPRAEFSKAHTSR
jgi:hypothetical protein